jgi:hypothetical protein
MACPADRTFAPLPLSEGNFLRKFHFLRNFLEKKCNFPKLRKYSSTAGWEWVDDIFRQFPALGCFVFDRTPGAITSESWTG